MKAAAGSLLPLLLAGCVTAPPEPMVSLRDRLCGNVMDFTAPLALTLDAPKPLEVSMGADNLCVTDARGQQSAYVVVQVPPSATPYYIDTASLIQGRALFAPRIYLMAADGRIAHAVPKEDFMFRGNALTAYIFVNPDDVARTPYLVIMSEPQTVGAQEQRVSSGVGGTYVSTGAAGANIYWGAESLQGYTYSYNGKLVLRAKTSQAGGAAAH